MIPIPKKRRTTQLVLFGESPAVPHWGDLDEPARVEVRRLLARLLVAVQAKSLRHVPCRRGARDE